MEYDLLEEQDAAPAEYTGPSKEDFLRQIQADHKQLSDSNPDDTDGLDKLEDRLSVVQAASGDEAASEAYFAHLAKDNPTPSNDEDGE